MGRKSIVCGFFVVLTMIVIFAFSSQPYELTMKTSNTIVEPIKNAVVDIRGKTFETEKEEKSYTRTLKAKLDKIVRKTAHIVLFAVLAVCVYIWLKSMGLDDADAIVLTLVICGMYAGSDEWHQSFVKGRTSQFIDVCVDEFGAVLSAVLLRLCHMIVKHSAQNKKAVL